MPDPLLLRLRHLLALAGLLALAVALGGCDAGDGTAPAEGGARLRLDTDAVQMGHEREADLTLQNVGDRAVGPVQLDPEEVDDPGGSPVPTAHLVPDPERISTLNPGAGADIRLRLELPGLLAPGVYTTAVTIRSDLHEIRVPVSFVVRDAAAEEVASITFQDPPSSVVQGTVTSLPVAVTDDAGEPLEGAPLLWYTIPSDAGFADVQRFVAYGTGTVKVVAEAGEAADTATLTVEPRGLSGSMEERTSVPAPGRTTSDLWVHGDAAYTGSWLKGSAEEPGNALFVWDVTDPDDPVLADSVIVDARVVNDVKVSPDGTLGLLTHELSEDGQNGVTLLDLTDPVHPEVIGRYTEGLAPGVHNAWLENDYAYLVVDGAGGLRVVDVSDPSDPVEVARRYYGSGCRERCFLHDVYVRDGLAFLSHWNAGLVILDVGDGGAGGSPSNPVLLSQTRGLGGQTHNAWYWPEAGYVFVGEEDPDEPGIMRILDVSDLAAPVQVATYSVPDDTPHNFWLDEDEAILYAAWYTNGVRALDVSGRLLGELDRQGREMAGSLYGDGGWCATGAGSTCAWAPQLHDGWLYVSDMRDGLVVLTPAR